jgi:hypothetical protein
MTQEPERTGAFQRVLAACACCATVAAVFATEPRLRVSAVAEPHPRLQEVGPGLKNPLPPVAKPALNGMVWAGLPFGVSVSDSRSVDPTGRNALTAGEVQSTVVPPGKKSECPQGRLLISNDAEKSPGYIAVLDLDMLDAQPLTADIDLPPGWNVVRQLKSNDHDLITLPDGDVLLLKMGRSKAPLDPKPAWFDFAYKLSDGFGPGARSEIFVWRSADCGEHFAFVKAIDTAMLDDGFGTLEDWSGGFPQKPKNYLGPPWQMGGTDGPLARVDPATGRVYVTIWLAGNVPDPVQEPFFNLTSTKLRRTVVMMSSDKGSSWTRAALLLFPAWRLDVVPRQNGTLAFAHSGGRNAETNEGSAFVVPACQIGCIVDPAIGNDVLDAPEQPAHWGWDQTPEDHPVLYLDENGPSDYMGVNVVDRGILTRSPSSQNLLFAFMDTIPGKGDGYRLFAHDGWSAWDELPPIAPQFASSGNFILHPTAIDPGRGPVFFYWYDVDTVTKAATVRGRLVTRDDKTTVDFTVSRSGSLPRSFDVTLSDRWYGDYHTAGGYWTLSGKGQWSHYTYYYFPVWVEPDGQVHFARLKYEMPFAVSRAAADALGYRILSRGDRVILRRAADLSTLDEEPDDGEPRPVRPSRQPGGSL